MEAFQPDVVLPVLITQQFAKAAFVSRRPWFWRVKQSVQSIHPPLMSGKRVTNLIFAEVRKLRDGPYSLMLCETPTCDMAVEHPEIA